MSAEKTAQTPERGEKLEQLVRVVAAYERCVAEFSDQRGFNEKCLCAACTEYFAAMTKLARELNVDEAQGDEVPVDGPVHTLFGLSYASHFVFPRTVLQSMPLGWQLLFVALVKEMETRFSLPRVDYQVTVRAPNGLFITDPIPPYDRGRTRLPPGWKFDTPRDP